jgi:hypothetical protein
VGPSHGAHAPKRSQYMVESVARPIFEGTRLRAIPDKVLQHPTDFWAYLRADSAAPPSTRGTDLAEHVGLSQQVHHSKLLVSTWVALPRRVARISEIR